jgi:hypothetical protein
LPAGIVQGNQASDRGMLGNQRPGDTDLADDFADPIANQRNVFWKRRRFRQWTQDLLVGQLTVPAAIAAADNDLIVHAGCPRRQRDLGRRLAGLKLGPIAPRWNRDVESRADLFQSNVRNSELRGHGGQWGRPHEIVELESGTIRKSDRIFTDHLGISSDQLGN